MISQYDTQLNSESKSFIKEDRSGPQLTDITALNRCPMTVLDTSQYSIINEKDIKRSYPIDDFCLNMILLKVSRDQGAYLS